MSNSIFNGRYLIRYFNDDGIELKRYIASHIEGFKGSFVVFCDETNGKRFILSGNVIIEEL